MELPESCRTHNRAVEAMRRGDAAEYDRLVALSNQQRQAEDAAEAAKEKRNS